jgi:hypothetical protein
MWLYKSSLFLPLRPCLTDRPWLAGAAKAGTEALLAVRMIACRTSYDLAPMMR